MLSLGEAEAAAVAAYESGDVRAMVESCVEVELLCANRDQPYAYAAIHMLGYLILGDLDFARFLWKRATTRAKEDPEFAQAWEIGKLLWQGKYGEGQELLERVQWGTNGPVACVRLAEVLRDKMRARTATLVTQGYQKIAVDEAAQLLALGREAAAEQLRPMGWQMSADGQWLVADEERAAEAQENGLAHKVATLEALVGRVQGMQMPRS